jgi:methylated-DNA-[protein]-cysteine S-methyltransferase
MTMPALLATGVPPRQDLRTHTSVPSPLGDLTLVQRSGELLGLYFRHHRPAPANTVFGTASRYGFDEFVAQLDDYLTGVRQGFDAAFRVIGPPRDQRVWARVAEIPYGSTSTYGRIARELGDGTTAQEVGAALARNPLSLVIPCHRVIGANGALTGYAGGRHRKRFLLDLEQQGSDPATRLF